jgi:hypothetical protein
MTEEELDLNIHVSYAVLLRGTVSDFSALLKWIHESLKDSQIVYMRKAFGKLKIVEEKAEEVNAE